METNKRLEVREVKETKKRRAWIYTTTFKLSQKQYT